MPDHAHVESVDALKRIRVALIKFAENVSVALDESDAEVQRADAWLKLAQPGYWKQQVTLRSELHTRAKSELSRKKMQTSGLNNRPSCIDEIKALARAERALEEARQKQAQVRRWAPLFDQESYTYAAAVQRLRTQAQTAVPRALAHLDAMIAAIEAYAPSPQWQGSTADGPRDGFASAAGGMARGKAGDAAVVSSFITTLRRRSPSTSERAELLADTATALPSGENLTGLPLVESGLDPPPLIDRITLATLLGAASAPPAPGDSIIVALDAQDDSRLYLERREPATPGDSGWYAGSAGPAAAPRRSVVRVSELLASVPALEAILALPPGWLVLLRGGRTDGRAAGAGPIILEALIDAENVLRWTGGESPGAIDGTDKAAPAAPHAAPDGGPAANARAR